MNNKMKNLEEVQQEAIDINECKNIWEENSLFTFEHFTSLWWVHQEAIEENQTRSVCITR